MGNRHVPPVYSPLCRLVRGCFAALLAVLGLAAGARAGPENAAFVAAEPAYWPPETGRELLAVDEPMRSFFSARVNRWKTDSERLRQIVEAIVRPEGLHFAYEADGIYDAREAFRRRRGSCVSFAFLVVAVARTYGINAQFQEFDTFQDWNRFDRFIAGVRHTNVRIATFEEVFVADLRPDFAPQSMPDTPRYVVRDATAFAHFYSTAGFFHLVNGDRDGALRLMNLGAATDARSRIVWANLGNLHLVNGDLGLARTCFEKSLRLDLRGDLTLVCLVEVLRRQGGAEDLKLADKYEHRAEALRERNPYYHDYLAGQAQSRGEWAAAEKQLRQALRLKDDEPIFREQLVAVLRQLGRADDARREEARLAKLRVRLAAAAGRGVQ